ncbi:uncharacterized protein [Solanum tuberosum]|uniref:uncharacterized protein isoform X2 n=1 Tax=Solanum tuberosum TaxID=4113 RepID=UPI00073A2819|nr:PREDICTED: uncharacterized protein LOC107058577 isoform X2 [Solanum tuberosum]
MNTVLKELLSGIVYASDAAIVWEDLNERFDKVDRSRIYQLHREICTIHQGNLIVSAYFTKLRLLWDEFNALVPPPSCSYDRSRSYMDHIQYLSLFGFLMRLSETYGHARSHILIMHPLPSVGKAYTMIVADESQIITSGTRIGGDMVENIALYTGRRGYNPGHNHTDGDKVESPMYPNQGNYNGKKKVN